MFQMIPIPILIIGSFILSQVATAISDNICAEVFFSYEARAYNNFCYFLHPGWSNYGQWSLAESYCVSKGGHLVSIHNKEEDDIVQELGNIYFNVWDFEGIWIGLNSHSLEGVWEWSDGTPVDYSNWGKFEPTIPHDSDAYITDVFSPTYTFDGKWYDGPKLDWMTLLCKVELYTCFEYYSVETSHVCGGGRGKCVSTDTCDCDPQFDGQECDKCSSNHFDVNTECNITSCNGIWNNDTSKSEVICNGRGKCQIYNQCTCEDHFGGADCQGCEEGYYGPYCNITTCNGVFSNVTNQDDVCQGHGTCTELNSCECTPEESYGGSDCQINICNGMPSTWNHMVCNGHGTCDSSLNCICSEDYFGTYCNITTCFGFLSNRTSLESGYTYNEGCSNHGSCTHKDSCVCSKGYYGRECDEASICDGKYGHDASVCSGHGACIQWSEDKYIHHEIYHDVKKTSSFCDCYDGYYSFGGDCGSYDNLLEDVSQRDAAGLCNVKNGDYVKIFGDYCYTAVIFSGFDSSHSVYDDAEDVCQKQGGHLVSIHSEEENEIVYQLGNEAKDGLKDAFGDNILYDDTIYIGLQKKGRGGEWLWNDGSPVDYLKFRDVMDPAFLGEYEHYLVVSTIDLDTRYWNDYMYDYIQFNGDGIPTVVYPDVQDEADEDSQMGDRYYEELAICKYKQKVIPSWALGLILMGWLSILGFLMLACTVFCVISCCVVLTGFGCVLFVYIIINGYPLVVVRKEEVEKINLLDEDGEAQEVELDEMKDEEEVEIEEEEEEDNGEDESSYDEVIE